MNAIGISYILRYYLYALHILVLLFEEIRNFPKLTNFIASKHQVSNKIVRNLRSINLNYLKFSRQYHTIKYN